MIQKKGLKEKIMKMKVNLLREGKEGLIDSKDEKICKKNNSIHKERKKSINRLID